MISVVAEGLIQYQTAQRYISMASVKSLFERHASSGGITNEAAWVNFARDLASFGLGSQGLSNLLTKVGGVLYVGSSDSSSSS